MASCVCLSDKRRYPLFFRTIPSDASQAWAMAELLRVMGWTWVGLVSADDDFGRSGIQMLMDALKGTEVCVAYYEVIPRVLHCTASFSMYFPYPLSFCHVHHLILNISFSLQELHKDDNSKDC